MSSTASGTRLLPLVHRTVASGVLWCVGCYCGPQPRPDVPYYEDFGPFDPDVCPSLGRDLATAYSSYGFDPDFYAIEQVSDFDTYDGRARFSLHTSTESGVFEIDLEGLISVAVPFPAHLGVHVWTGNELAFEDSEPDSNFLSWRRSPYGADVLRRDLNAEYPDVMCGGDLRDELHMGGGDIHLVPGRYLWIHREEGCRGLHQPFFATLYRVDGHRPYGRGVAAPDRMGTVFDDTMTAAPDGSLWYLAEWQGADAPELREPGARMLRLTPDGHLFVSPLLIEPDGWELRPGTTYAWAAVDAGAVTPDGGYIVHFLVQPRGFTSIHESHVARVRPDGSLAWTWHSPRDTAAHILFESAFTSDGEGGAFIALVNQFNPTEISVVHLLADGSTPTGSPGNVVVRDLPPGQLRDFFIERDDAGGFYLGWMVHLVGRYVAIQRFEGDGTPVWPDFQTLGGVNGDSWSARLRRDGRGGVWAYSAAFGWDSRLQHYTAEGHAMWWQLPNGTGERRCPVGSFVWPRPEDTPITLFERNTTRGIYADGAILSGDAGPLRDAPAPDAAIDASCDRMGGPENVSGTYDLEPPLYYIDANGWEAGILTNILEYHYDVFELDLTGTMLRVTNQDTDIPGASDTVPFGPGGAFDATRRTSIRGRFVCDGVFEGVIDTPYHDETSFVARRRPPTPTDAGVEFDAGLPDSTIPDVRLDGS